jgi:hypothetical protein
MHAKNCSLIGWILVLSAFALLAAEGQLGLLAVLLLLSFLFACAIARSQGPTATLSSNGDKR